MTEQLINNTTELCSYGCQQLAKYKLPNGKLCCSTHYTKCPKIRQKIGKTSGHARGKLFNNIENKLCDYGCNRQAKYIFKNGKVCCEENCVSCQKYKDIASIIRHGIHFKQDHSNRIKCLRENTSTCKYCNSVYTTTYITYHENFCHSNANKQHKETANQYIKAKELGLERPTYKVFSTVEFREGCIQRLIKYHKENPEKHNWACNIKNNSVPCEDFKLMLKKLNFVFEEEYQASKFTDRLFRIDIAFPEQKVGVEINGNQHYSDTKTETLADYYLDRHQVIENAGWKLFEIRFNKVYEPDYIENFIVILMNELS